MTETFARIRNLLAEEFHANPLDITPATALTDLGVDSLAALEFAFVLEETFKVTLDPQSDLRGGRVADLVAVVERALVAPPATSAVAA